MYGRVINLASVIWLYLLTAVIVFVSSFSSASLVLFTLLFIVLNIVIKRNKLLVSFSFLIGIIFMVCVYHYWIIFYGSPYWLGAMSDDWQFDKYWTEGYIAKYGISVSGLSDHLNDLEPGLGILHNSRGYVMFIIYIRYFAELFDGYDTLMPRMFNIWLLTLIAYYGSIIAFNENKSRRAERLTFISIFFFPVLLMNSCLVFRDTMISFILIFSYLMVSTKRYSYLTVLMLIPLLFVLFFLRTTTFLVCLIMIALIYSNINKINGKMILLTLVFGTVILTQFDFFLKDTLEQYAKYQILNIKRFGTIGSAIFSLPISVGVIPRSVYLIFTPVPNFSSGHQLFFSISAVMQILSFPYLIAAFNLKVIHLRLKLTFLLFFFGVAITSADFRHVMMYLPFGIILASVSYVHYQTKGGFAKRYYLLSGLLFVLFITSVGLAIVLK